MHMNKKFLRSHLNNFVDSGYAYVYRWALATYGNQDWSEIRSALNDWESAGFLTIIRDPENCDDNEICLEMHNFIDATEPLPKNWLSKSRLPPKWPEGKTHTRLDPPLN